MVAGLWLKSWNTARHRLVFENEFFGLSNQKLPHVTNNFIIQSSDKFKLELITYMKVRFWARVPGGYHFSQRFVAFERSSFIHG